MALLPALLMGRPYDEMHASREMLLSDYCRWEGVGDELWEQLLQLG